MVHGNINLTLIVYDLGFYVLHKVQKNPELLMKALYLWLP